MTSYGLVVNCIAKPELSYIFRYSFDKPLQDDIRWNVPWGTVNQLKWDQKKVRIAQGEFLKIKFLNVHGELVKMRLDKRSYFTRWSC